MYLTEQITLSEKKYKQKLDNFFTCIFCSTRLSSHGLDHHHRVWSYAKVLLFQLEKHGFKIKEPLATKLIIACHLHDSGMSVDPGFNHGKKSRDICQQFLQKNRMPPDKYKDVLEAIENHDHKEYTASGRPDDLLTILSAADDLDAFGFTGIYRYLEIYITRNIPFKELGYLIKENAGKRFIHFFKTFGFSSTLINEHRQRFDTVDSFFSEYNRQVASYIFDSQKPEGYCGVADYINYMLRNSPETVEFNPGLQINNRDPVVQWFFKGLNKDLSCS